MAAKVTSLPRVFQYQGTEFPDPGASLSPAEVLQALASAHPELTNALVEGPVVEAGKQVFKVKVAAGTKG